MYGLEHRHLPGDNTTYRSRSGGIRRRMVTGVDRHFRLCWGGWELEGFRPAESRAFDDFVRDASAQVWSSATRVPFPIGQASDPASVEDMLQSTRLELYGHFPRRRNQYSNPGYEEPRSAGHGVDRSPGPGDRCPMEYIREATSGHGR